jgi:predicted DCC family thiol-disulfide oxidoreductase YuxK
MATFTTERYPLFLFYDNNCSFCVRWVYRVKEADPERRLRYSPQQGQTFPQVVEAHPELRDIESVVLLKRDAAGVEQVYVRSRAIQEAIRGLPKLRFFQFVLAITPRFLADLGYDFFAKYRGTLVGAWHGIRAPIEEDTELYVG